MTDCTRKVRNKVGWHRRTLKLSFHLHCAHMHVCTVGAYAHQPVMFSSEPDLPEVECEQLLLQYMPENIQKTKVTQRLFIK